MACHQSRQSLTLGQTDGPPAQWQHQTPSRPAVHQDVRRHEWALKMRKRSNRITAGLCFSSRLTFLGAGCATTLSTSAQRVKVADTPEISSCRFVSDVHGSSGWGNLAASTGMQNAKNEALEQAASAGATHVVWTNLAGGYSPFATGKAYRCN